MKRTARGRDDARRYERWGFDDPAPVAPKAREERVPPKAREERVAREDLAAAQVREAPIAPKAREEIVMPSAREEPPHRTPQPRPSNPAASPWRKIQIPDEERQRAALAGLDRYVGKPANGETAARRALPIGARFAAPREETPPVAPPKPAYDPAAEDDALARAAAARMRHPRRPEAPRAMPPPAQGNPHLGLTVGVIVAVSLMAAIGLSWVAAPAIDATPPQRADLLQRASPQPQTGEPAAGQARPATPDALIEVAPSMPARALAATAAQPIEVAP